MTKVVPPRRTCGELAGIVLLAMAWSISTAAASDAVTEADALSLQATALRKQSHDREAFRSSSAPCRCTNRAGRGPTRPVRASPRVVGGGGGAHRPRADQDARSVGAEERRGTARDAGACAGTARVGRRVGDARGAQISSGGRAAGTLPLRRPLRVPVGSAASTSRRLDSKDSEGKSMFGGVLSREHVALVSAGGADVAVAMQVASSPSGAERAEQVPPLVRNGEATEPRRSRRPPRPEATLNRVQAVVVLDGHRCGRRGRRRVGGVHRPTRRRLPGADGRRMSQMVVQVGSPRPWATGMTLHWWSSVPS